MAELIEWDSSATAHIRTRSDRYTGAVNIECTWTVEVVNDPDRLVDEPDPRSAHANTVRIVGYSPTARTVLKVVALRDRNGLLHGVSAWKNQRRPAAPVPRGRNR